MNKRSIDIFHIMSLRGPNIWTYRPTLEAWVDIGDLEDCPSNTIPGFYERLSSWIPSLIEHRCSIGERGGFLQRVREGTWPAHILEHVTLELQNLAGVPASGFGKARETSVRGVYKVVVRARQEQVTRAALFAARDLVMAAIDDRPFDVAGAVDKLRGLADSLCIGPSTGCIVDAAGERRIPALRLSEGNLVQLGYGIHQRRIWTAETDRTGAIAENISRDKDLTKSLLAPCGVPIPEGRLVSSPGDAWAAAEEIGLPVVVKPDDGNHGRGVSTDLRSREEIEAAYAVALAEGGGVIVERFVSGDEHRLLVIGGRVVAAARGESATVTGDGRTTIAELIDRQINTDPRRGEEEDYPLTPILLEREPAARLQLERQGLTADSVPPVGKRVLIQRHGNVTEDVTELVHPEVAAMATLAARIVGLDIAGVDLVAEDIARPLEEQKGAIVEVNAGPGLLMHLKPAQGAPRPIGAAIVESLFPNGGDGRVPIVGVTGTNGKTVVARLVSRLLALAGKHVGLACSDGFYLGARRVGDTEDGANWASAHRALLSHDVEAAVCENGSGAILTEGLAYDRCLVGVVTNIDGADHLGDCYVESPEQMYNVLRTQVDVVLPEGTAVLNARDPLVAKMAELCDGEVIFFAPSPDFAPLAPHLAEGKRAVFQRDGCIILATGEDEIVLADIAALPLAYAGRVAFQLENILAATAAGWALGLAPELIRAGMETFDVGQDDAPGRFTLFERAGATVVVDSAHNASALAALAASLEHFPAKRRLVLWSAGADRRDADLQDQGRLLAAHFDEICLSDDTTVPTRRTAGEARSLLRRGVEGTEGPKRCALATEEAIFRRAAENLLGRLKKGDLLVIQAGEGNATPALDLVRSWIGR